jgi:hypothetical protein
VPCQCVEASKEISTMTAPGSLPLHARQWLPTTSLQGFRPGCPAQTLFLLAFWKEPLESRP